MMAKAGPNKDDPDIIQKAQPVADALAVKSRIENLVGQLVEPGLEGVQAAPIRWWQRGKLTLLMPGCRLQKHRVASWQGARYQPLADCFQKSGCRLVSRLPPV
jgi:hypothetical protein